MKLFLIKLGKAWMTIKKNGILAGGKRVLEYFWVFLKSLFSVKNGDVLFITGGVGDSARYRSYHHAEELNSHNIKTSVAIQDNPFLSRLADKFSVFVFQKAIYTPTVKKLIDNIKSQKKTIIFETDDLVYDEYYFQQTDYYKTMDDFTRKQYKGGQGAEIVNDSEVKFATTTTQYLADKLKKKGKRVFIVRNKLSQRDLEIVDKILNNQSDSLTSEERSSTPSTRSRTPKLDEIKIGYFSGTISHNKDFATITEALMRIMEKYSQVELFLAGPLDVDNKLNKFKNRIKKVPMVSRDKHFENISQVDINLAPLEIGQPFCESKSELKFFEAGILGIPSVAAATGVFKDAISDGENSFVAADSEEWFRKIEKLILDPELRQRMGKKAREKVLKNYTTVESNNEEYYNFLRELINKK